MPNQQNPYQYEQIDIQKIIPNPSNHKIQSLGKQQIIKEHNLGPMWRRQWKGSGAQRRGRGHLWVQALEELFFKSESYGEDFHFN